MTMLWYIILNPVLLVENNCMCYTYNNSIKN